MENTPTENTNQYWRSLDEKYQTPEFLKTLENEFQSSPLKSEDGKDGLARRQFMKLMGASVALSAAACVRRPVQKIIPYNKRPSEIIPSLPNYYASAWFDGGQGFGLIVKTREGRPLYVAGNPEHPLNGQGLSARASAHILSLYDPDRLKGPVFNSVNPKGRNNSLQAQATWLQIDQKVAEQLKKGEVALLTSSYPSEHTQDLMSSFLSKFSGKKYVWDTLSTENIREAQKISYGTAVVPHYHFEKSQLTVSLDADFLGTHLSPVHFSRDFKKAHDPEGKKMAKLISFHSVPSLTSLNADDGHPVSANQQLGVALALLQRVLAGKGTALSAELKKFALDDKQLGLEEGTLKQVAVQLLENSGQSLVIAGGLQTATENGLNLQLVTNWINSALGNEGQTVTAQGSYLGLEGSSSDVFELVKNIEAGKVKTLIVHNLNPVYDLPESLGFIEKLNKVEMLISTSNWYDETARLANVVAPSGHAMENWNEFEFVSGLHTIQQPTVRPLNDTRSFEDSLITWAHTAGQDISLEKSFYDLLKKKVTAAVGSEEAWYEYLQKGFRGQESHNGSARSLSASAVNAIKPVPAKASDELELVIFPTVHMTDGSLANVSWLQELPDPVSKIVWDNALTLSPKTAKAMGVKDGTIVAVDVNGKTLKVPAYVQPGQSDKVAGLALGYGRQVGELAKGVGVNAAQLIQTSGNQFLYAGLPVKVQKTAEFSELAITQGHNSMEGRQIVAETTFKNYKQGQTGIHRHQVFSIWGQHKYDGHKWGMSIDLNSCTGCSACMMACQSENNIPVVGKKYVLQGREMHWIRIDRYYSGDESAPDAVFQPLLCQHCENAPCETVCPVVATVHSDEGLNDMVYNRCVGTRYCSNNCPYKVRRFNWFYYDGHHRKDNLHMALNPEVTVRTRGVMEKCTFCVQRIKEGKNTAKDENRPLKDGDIKTACQEVCPTNAIVFGDLNDKDSQVSKMFAAQRQYTLLEEVNAAPRVRYMAKIRNTDRSIGGGHHGTEKHAPSHESKDSHKETHT
jgi:MoCo/4Fe-4S cofactor protein with predicted Tat translocation signal